MVVPFIKTKNFVDRTIPSYFAIHYGNHNPFSMSYYEKLKPQASDILDLPN